MADTNLQTLIDYVRRYGQAAADDEFNGETYWSDDQIEEFLMSRGTMKVVPLHQVSDTIYSVNAPKHHKLRADFSVYEEDTPIGNTALVDVFTYDFYTNTVTFATAQTEERLYAFGLVIHLWDALADFWDVKASQRAGYVNFRAGHNVMNMREEYDHCIAQRNFYRNKTIRRYAK